MPKKWPRPCAACQGKLELACIICGHKLPKKKPQRDMTNLELAALRGKRNRAQFLHDLDCSMTRAANCTTEDQAVDALIADHREWAMEAYCKHRHDGVPLKEIADKFDLTVELVRRIIQLVSDKVNRGAFEIYPNGPTPFYIAPHSWDRPSTRIPGEYKFIIEGEEDDQ